MKAQSKQLFNEINITPLTDIFLVLLIIMMVVAPMMQQNRSDIKPPVVQNGLSVKQGILTVEVTANGDYFVNGAPTTAESLTSTLVSANTKALQSNVMIRADKTTKSAAVLKVLEAAKEARFEKVTVAGQNLSRERQNELETSAS